jgi:hypothetical protein
MSFTMGGVMNGAAWALAGGSTLFAVLGINEGRDGFLMLGLVACMLGNAAFAAYLWDQGGAARSNDALATVFICFALLTLYAIACQFERWRVEGCGDDEEEEEAEADEDKALVAGSPEPAEAAAATRGATSAGSGTGLLRKRK